MAKDTRQFFKKGFENVDGVHTLNDKELTQLKKVLLGILKDFVKVADKYHLNYSLSGGSVLGAVRHHGFIPWDDDIDINMPRADYNRLTKIFDKELSDRYVLCAPETGHRHGMAHAQMKRKNTICQSFNELSKEAAYCGIYIDIFVIENTFDNKVLRAAQGVISLAVGYCMTCRKTADDMPYLLPYLKNNGELQRVLRRKALIGKALSFISIDSMAKITCVIYSMCKNNNSRYVTIPSGRKHFFGELQPRKGMLEYKKAEFEGEQVNIPKGYSSYLAGLYGENYMELPPLEKREQHPLMCLKFDTEENNE